MKSKIAKKILAASLVASMTMGLAACGGSETPAASESAPAPAESSVETPASSEAAPAEPTAAPEEELSPYTVVTDANGNVPDLGGMEIIIRDWWSGEPAEPANAFEEAQAEYREWIQETYNFTIKEMAISDWGSTPQDFSDYVSSGGDDNNYIFVLRQGGELVSAMNSGLMYDLSTLDCLDFSEDKWVSGIHNLLAKDGAIYGMRGIDPEPRIGIFFNKRLLEEAGVNPEDIYTWQENGEWTWEKFEEVCAAVHADTDNDGVIDRYAMMNFPKLFHSAAVYSNGGNFIGMGDAGFVNELETDATMSALTWANDMITKYDAVLPEGAAWNYWIEGFANGEAVFTADEAYEAGTWITTMEDDYGFVCFPMGPNASDYTNVYNDNPMVIPACYDDEKAWKLAFAYNLYTEPVPGYEDYEGWKATYYNNFKDTESVDLTLARMMSNGRVTYHDMVPGLDLGNDYFYVVNKDNTPAQIAETVRNSWQALLDEANK